MIGSDCNNNKLRDAAGVKRGDTVGLTDEAECDEVYIVAGHKGKPDEVEKKGGGAGADDSEGNADAAHLPRRSPRSSG
jgi:hypothetical protein